MKKSIRQMFLIPSPTSLLRRSGILCTVLPYASISSETGSELLQEQFAAATNTSETTMDSSTETFRLVGGRLLFFTT